MRCNIICVEDGKIKNHSAGHISNEEAYQLVDYLNEELGDDVVKFFSGVSYRHLLKIKGGDKRVSCTPPHDVPGTPYSEVLVKADCPEAENTAELLNKLILKSMEILPKHPVNLKGCPKGKIQPTASGHGLPATSLK
jgi:2,3-bisphosphoglycerate-independent phosphoglycerate mutase